MCMYVCVCVCVFVHDPKSIQRVITQIMIAITSRLHQLDRLSKLKLPMDDHMPSIDTCVCVRACVYVCVCVRVRVCVWIYVCVQL
jgi:hypothetical protein